MVFFTKREQVVILLLVVIVLVISLFSFIKKNTKNNLNTSNEEISPNIIGDDEQNLYLEEEEKTTNIMVHISGQVNKPGIVELAGGSRLIDAVNMVGGLKDKADLDKINLAKKLNDEEKIYIPKLGEDDSKINEIGYDNNNISNQNNDKININTASVEELKTLPGVGDVLANRIVEYRENNIFRSINDIQNVSGIGNKKFEDIKNLIKIE